MKFIANHNIDIGAPPKVKTIEQGQPVPNLPVEELMRLQDLGAITGKPDDEQGGDAGVASKAEQKAAAKRAESERKATEKAAADKAAADKREAERIEAERIEAERIEAERIEAERLEAERIEAERIEAERVEAERKAAAELNAQGNPQA